MLPRSPRPRAPGSPIRTVLGIAAAALIGTAVGGVSVLSIVIAMTSPSHDVRSRPGKDAASAAMPPPVLTATPQQPQPPERTPPDQATAAPANQTKPPSADARDPRPEAPQHGTAQASPAASQDSKQTPEVTSAPPPANQQAGANGGDNRQDSRRARSSRSKRFAVTRDGPARGDPTRDSSGNNSTADNAVPQRRDASRTPLFNSYGGRWRDDRDQAGPPPRGVIIIPDRGYGGPDRSTGWGGFFGGGNWGGNDW